jgi:hypothetical protein
LRRAFPAGDSGSTIAAPKATKGKYASKPTYIANTGLMYGRRRKYKGKITSPITTKAYATPKGKKSVPGIILPISRFHCPIFFFFKNKKHTASVIAQLRGEMIEPILNINKVDPAEECIVDVRFEKSPIR